MKTEERPHEIILKNELQHFSVYKRVSAADKELESFIRLNATYYAGENSEDSAFRA